MLLLGQVVVKGGRFAGLNLSQILQGGPLQVINEVISLINGLK